MTVFDDAQVVGNQLLDDLVSMTEERDALVLANQAQAQQIADLTAELAACQNPPPPVDLAVPMGIYSGTINELVAAEDVCGSDHTEGSWLFQRVGGTIPAGWNTGRRNVIYNIQYRQLSGANIPWPDITSGKYDAQLEQILTSIGQQDKNAPQYISVNQEQDADQVHTPAQYEAAFIHVKALADVFAPDALVGQVCASSARFGTWHTKAAEWYGLDPHAYTWNGDTGAATAGTFASRVAACYQAMVDAGVSDRPMVINTGAAEPVAGPKPGNVIQGNTAKADPAWKAKWIEDMVTEHRDGRARYPNWEFSTWWNRNGVINGRACDERFTSSPASLTAFSGLFEEV